MFGKKNVPILKICRTSGLDVMYFSMFFQFRKKKKLKLFLGTPVYEITGFIKGIIDVLDYSDFIFDMYAASCIVINWSLLVHSVVVPLWDVTEPLYIEILRSNGPQKRLADVDLTHLKSYWVIHTISIAALGHSKSLWAIYFVSSHPKSSWVIRLLMLEVHQFKIRYTVTQWWLPPHCTVCISQLFFQNSKSVRTICLMAFELSHWSGGVERNNLQLQTLLYAKRRQLRVGNEGVKVCPQNYCVEGHKQAKMGRMW